MIYANIQSAINDPNILQFELLTYSTLNDVWGIEKGLPSAHFMDSIVGAVPVGLDMYVFNYQESDKI